MEDNLLLFFTGYTHSAGEILKEQDARSKKNEQSMIANLHVVKQIGRDVKDAIEAGNLHRFGELMNTHWEYKKERSPVDEQRADQSLVRSGAGRTARSEASSSVQAAADS